MPISIAGAVRASGPIWTMIGGAVIFQEFLTPLQLVGVLVSIAAYYLFSLTSRKEGIRVLRSLPMLAMLLATLLSAMTTVYDKFIVQHLGLPIFEVQAYSAVHRWLIAALLFAAATMYRNRPPILKWSWAVPLVGLSWVAAEWLYFFAVADAAANVTFLAIFRRMSLVVGFLLSAILLNEKNLAIKSILIAIILLATILLLLS